MSGITLIGERAGTLLLLTITGLSVFIVVVLFVNEDGKVEGSLKSMLRASKFRNVLSSSKLGREIRI